MRTGAILHSRNRMARHMHWAILAYVLCIAKYMQLLIYSKLEETGFGIASRPTEEILSCREPVQNLCLQDVATTVQTVVCHSVRIKLIEHCHTMN